MINGERGQAHYGGTIPKMVVLASVRQAEQTTRSKAVSSTPPRPLHQLLPPCSCPADGLKSCKLKQTLSSPNCFWSLVFYRSGRNPNTVSNPKMHTIRWFKSLCKFLDIDADRTLELSSMLETSWRIKRFSWKARKQT